MTWESGNADTGLRFAMLGPLQVTRSGERLALGGRQQRAVLAVLLAEAGAVVSVGNLADAPRATAESALGQVGVWVK